MIDALSLARDPGSNGKGGVRVIMALQSARLMTHQYSKEEAEILLSLFPNVISLRVSDPMSRAVVSERYGKAHYLYSYAGVGEKIHHQDSVEDVVSDYHFHKLRKKDRRLSVCLVSVLIRFFMTATERRNLVMRKHKKLYDRMGMALLSSHRQKQTAPIINDATWEILMQLHQPM